MAGPDSEHGCSMEHEAFGYPIAVQPNRKASIGEEGSEAVIPRSADYRLASGPFRIDRVEGPAVVQPVGMRSGVVDRVRGPRFRGRTEERILAVLPALNGIEYLLKKQIVHKAISLRHRRAAEGRRFNETEANPHLLRRVRLYHFPTRPLTSVPNAAQQLGHPMQPEWHDRAAVA